MDFKLTDDQVAISDLATSLFREHGSDEHARSLQDAGQAIDRALWQKLVDTGLLAVALPESCGGSGMGMLELGLVLQQQGRFLAAAPMSTHALVTLAVATQGSSVLRDRVMPSLLSGERPAALATELDVTTALIAEPGELGWILEGQLSNILLEPWHEFLLAPAQTPQGTRLFLLDLKHVAPKRTTGKLTDMQTVCELYFTRAIVSVDSELGTSALEWLKPRMACCISAYQLGVLEEALHRAAAYVSERQQFGRPLGSFQALAVRAADAYIQVELLRSAQLQLAWRIDQGLPTEAAARVSKHQASQAGHMVGHTAQHFHGGVGADLQYPIHRFYLKSQAFSHIGGGAEAQLARIGRALADNSFAEYIHE
ncbi:acyl-CoA dehydrogenase family protein [Variovorax sp. J31P207]|uniref:acyl-CoA dehydrogenase family protein n=1 Tax=Variovorax sp. J31P207 TaxID=3053510 RepID=UPI00257525AE|nr:acyl-CoA dehydrogenase family protein [Variovorax sp. J31P207]MDM0069974.1 acyl-CoA dehydrogenase family protein [Variovorax sp. J31P207]